MNSKLVLIVLGSAVVVMMLFMLTTSGGTSGVTRSMRPTYVGPPPPPLADGSENPDVVIGLPPRSGGHAHNHHHGSHNKGGGIRGAPLPEPDSVSSEVTVPWKSSVKPHVEPEAPVPSLSSPDVVSDPTTVESSASDTRSRDGDGDDTDGDDGVDSGVREDGDDVQDDVVSASDNTGSDGGGGGDVSMAVTDWDSLPPLQAFHARVCERFRSDKYPFDAVPRGRLSDQYFEKLLVESEIYEIKEKLTDPAKLSFNFVLQHTDDASGAVTPSHVYWKHGDYRAGESAWNEALAYAVDRTFGFGLIPPTRMVMLDLDDMKSHLATTMQARGAGTQVAAQHRIIENWRDNAKENLKKRWAKSKKYDMIGVNVLFYGWPLHDSSGPRKFQWNKEAKTVTHYTGDVEAARSFSELNMLVWLCNCPRSAHGYFYDANHKRWVMLDNDRCLTGKRLQPFPNFLYTCQFPTDIVTKLRQVWRDKSACKEVKAFMKERDPLAAEQVIPRFKRKAKEHGAVELPNGKCALNERVKQLLDHVDWCLSKRGDQPGGVLFDRAANIPGRVDDVREATATEIANGKTGGPNAPKKYTGRTKKKKKK